MYYFGWMKVPFPIVLATALWVIPQVALTQTYKNEKVIYLDADGHPTKLKKAALIEQVIQFGDTLWEFNIYNQPGHCIRSIQCSDAEGNVFNGRFVSYSLFGTADTIGDCVKGSRSGQWGFYTPQGRLLGHQFYKNGELLWTKDTLQIQHELDSVKALHADNSRTAKKLEFESNFPGGAMGWLQYLNKSLRYPDDAVNNRVQGTVIVDFLVDTTGHIPASSVWVSRSIDFDLDEEAVRMILNSPAWIPASRNGRLVKSYKRQPIVFSFQSL